jgi:dihydrofolate reductase
MIRFIAALDNKNGIANDNGIPWQGKIPTDVAFYRDKTTNSNKLMGYVTYLEQDQTLAHGENFVATSKSGDLRPGFKIVVDAREFLRTYKQDIWVVGGAGLFTSTIDLADELYLTKLESDFSCTKFFPEYESSFERVNRSAPISEGGIKYCFEVWKRKSKTID